jgi:hypothetical protein
MCNVIDLRILRTGLLAALAVFSLTLSAEAQCSGGGQGGGGQMSGRAMAGMGMGGNAMGNNSFTSQNSLAAAQMENTLYLYNMQASHNNMMQQIHQHQMQQKEALRQASANRKRIAAEKALQASNKAKTKTNSTNTKAIELTQSN